MIIQTKNGDKFIIKFKYKTIPMLKYSKDKYGRYVTTEWDEYETYATLKRIPERYDLTQVAFTGVAKCSYKDEYNKTNGKKLALRRAIDEAYCYYFDKSPFEEMIKEFGLSSDELKHLGGKINYYIDQNNWCINTAADALKAITDTKSKKETWAQEMDRREKENEIRKKVEKENNELEKQPIDEKKMKDIVEFCEKECTCESQENYIEHDVNVMKLDKLLVLL